MSGGQRQMVAAARSIAFESKILIMDAPTAALGVKLMSDDFKHKNVGIVTAIIMSIVFVISIWGVIINIE